MRPNTAPKATDWLCKQYRDGSTNVGFWMHALYVVWPLAMLGPIAAVSFVHRAGGLYWSLPVAVLITLILAVPGRAGRHIRHIAFAPMCMLLDAVGGRRWKLAAGMGLLLPVMLAGLWSAVLTPSSSTATTTVTGWAQLTAIGCRNTGIVALVAMTVALLFGVPLGTIWAHRRVGSAVQGTLSAIDALPLLGVLLLAAPIFRAWSDELGVHGVSGHIVLGPIAIGSLMGLWLAPSLAQLVGDKIEHFRAQQFIDASLSAGIGYRRIIWYHIIYRNILPDIAVAASQLTGLAVLFETSLGYLFKIFDAPGSGLYLSLSHLLSQDAVRDAFLRWDEGWWRAALPMACIVLLVLGLMLHGDGLRDYLEEIEHGGSPMQARLDANRGRDPGQRPIDGQSGSLSGDTRSVAYSDG